MNCLKFCILPLIVLVLFQHEEVFVCGQQCGTVGRVGEVRVGTGDNRAHNEFYIDRRNRAECTGNISSISYCYHRSPLFADEYIATVAVYTPASNAINEILFTVSSSPIVILKTILEVNAELGSGDFACSELTLPQPVPIFVGDVLGACLFEPPISDDNKTRYRLDLVSRLGSFTFERDEDLVRTDTNPNNPAGCSATGVPGLFDASAPDTDIVNGRSVHLWANIVSELTDPSTDPPTTSSTDPLTVSPTDPPASTTDTDIGSTTTQQDTTLIMINPPVNGNAVESNLLTIVIAVVASNVATIVLVSIIVLLIVVVVWRRRKQQPPAINPRKDTNLSQQPQEVLYEEIRGPTSINRTLSMPVPYNAAFSVDKNTVVNYNPLYQGTPNWVEQSISNEYCIIPPMYPPREEEASQSTTTVEDMTNNEAYGTVLENTESFIYDSVM